MKISDCDEEEYLEVVYQNTFVTRKEQPEEVPPESMKDNPDQDIICVDDDSIIQTNSLKERTLTNFKGRTKINLDELFFLYPFYVHYILF